MLNPEKYLRFFKDYTSTFLHNCENDNTTENIRLKIKHSLNVFKHSLEISKSENLNAKDYFLAGVCGLFHDIGRFEQFTKYNTFVDSNSIYHGSLGVEVVEREQVFNDLTDSMIKIIKAAIYNHGLISIEKYENEKELFFSKLVRDADKADIYRIVAEYYKSTGPRNIALEYGLEDVPEISASVMELFKAKQVIPKFELKTLNDFKLMQIAWLFDLNFDYTRAYIIKNKFPEIVLNTMNGDNIKAEVSYYLQEILFNLKTNSNLEL